MDDTDTYTCATCGATTTDLVGWSKIVLQAAVYEAGTPISPFIAEGPPLERYFHAEPCRTTWLERVAAEAR
jgi:hypothetical protein